MALLLMIVSSTFHTHASMDLFGDSFDDKFKSFDIMLWRKADRSIACMEENCIYASVKQVQPMRGFVDMKLQDNCNDPIRCCLWESNTCTNYTGGMLISNQLYTYGSFRFRAQPVHDGFAVLVGQHCLGITSGHPAYGFSSKIAVVAMCHIHDTNQIWLFSRSGDDIRTRMIHKFFQRSRSYHVYRMDWKLNSVQYFMNGFLVGTLGFDSHVPSQGMHIFAQMVPDGMKKWIPPEFGDIKFAGQMILHRVRYTRYSKDKIEEDSYGSSTITSGVSPTNKLILMAAIIPISVCFAKWGVYFLRRIRLEGGYDKLVNQEHS